jgi:hypothetical protein
MTNQLSMSKLLAELKTYDGRIKKAIGSIAPIAAVPTGTTVVNGRKIEDFNTDAAAALQSIKALIENKKRLEAAKVASNATTMVGIGGAQYTVANAIKRKSDISYEKQLLAKLQEWNRGVVANYERFNTNLTVNEIPKLISDLYGKDGANSAEAITFSTNYFETHKAILVDPLGLKDVIDGLEADIDAFELDADGALSEINAVTQVTVDYAD